MYVLLYKTCFFYLQQKLFTARVCFFKAPDSSTCLCLHRVHATSSAQTACCQLLEDTVSTEALLTLISTETTVVVTATTMTTTIVPDRQLHPTLLPRRRLRRKPGTRIRTTRGFRNVPVSSVYVSTYIDTASSLSFLFFAFEFFRI